MKCNRELKELKILSIIMIISSPRVTGTVSRRLVVGRPVGARGRRASRKHDGDGTLPRVRRRRFLNAMPKRCAETYAETSSTNVDCLH